MVQTMVPLLLSLMWFSAHAACGPPQLPAVHRVTGVPLVEGSADLCGPAALAAVLSYHGDRISTSEIADAIHLPSYRGSLNLDLLVFARQRGFEAWTSAGSSDQLRGALAGDRPVICMVRRSNPLAGRNHFVVVKGYDWNRQVWFVDSGEGKDETLRATDFDAEWGRCDHWMLVIEGKKPAGAETCAKD
jgi:ABC-type bacteriocin/lantibiotic exporter with double-glycine peptidase domain